MKNKRVVSPFLSVYKPQYSSVFSILERVTGLLVTLVVIFHTFMMYFTSIFLTNYSFYSLVDFLYLDSGFVINGAIFFVILNVVYHVIFGCRFLYWDRTGGVLNYGIDLNTLYKSSEVLSLCVLLGSLLILVYFVL